MSAAHVDIDARSVSRNADDAEVASNLRLQNARRLQPVDGRGRGEDQVHDHLEVATHPRQEILHSPELLVVKSATHAADAIHAAEQAIPGQMLLELTHA